MTVYDGIWKRDTNLVVTYRSDCFLSLHYIYIFFISRSLLCCWSILSMKQMYCMINYLKWQRALHDIQPCITYSICMTDSLAWHTALLDIQPCMAIILPHYVLKTFFHSAREANAPSLASSSSAHGPFHPTRQRGIWRSTRQLLALNTLALRHTSNLSRVGLPRQAKTSLANPSYSWTNLRWTLHTGTKCTKISVSGSSS